MIYITQLVYVREGQEKIFDKFEEVAIPIIPKYNGSLVLRIRPTPDAFIDSIIEKPYEIHLISFPSQDDFQSFMKDADRKLFLHLKDQSIRSSILIMGQKLGVEP